MLTSSLQDESSRSGTLECFPACLQREQLAQTSSTNPIKLEQKIPPAIKNKPFDSQIEYPLLQSHQHLVDFQLFPSCAHREMQIQELSPAGREKEEQEEKWMWARSPLVGLGFTGASCCSGALLSQQSHSRNLGAGQRLHFTLEIFSSLTGSGD